MTRRLVAALLILLATAPAIAQQPVTVTNTNLDVQIGGTDTVATNITQVGGTTQSATNPLPVRLTDGSAFLTPDTQSVYGSVINLTAGAAPTGGFSVGGCRVSASAPATTGVADDEVQWVWCKNTGEVQVGVVSSALPSGAATSANQTTAQTSFSAIQTAVELIDNDQTGWSKAAVTSTASTNDTVVKSSAGRLSSIQLINTTATLYYLRLYDVAAGDPTCSSATGFFVSLPVPASATGAGFAFTFPNGGIAFSNGIGYCLTASSGSTANDNAAAGIFGVISYK